MQKFITSNAMVCAMRPEHPVYCLHPRAVTIATSWFLDNFPGRVLFAVKTNPFFVDTISAAGLQHFDVASLGEIELIHAKVPGARMSFMHPVKSRVSIRRAYFEFGIRDFALDCEAELTKILEETQHANDLNLFVRLSVSNRHSRLDLSGKFGISGKPAAKLLLKARQAAMRLGICFHAGSQLMRPEAYADAMEVVSKLIRSSGVIIDVLDVGGGFPSIYPDMTPPPLADFIAKISESFEQMPVSETCELWCEPGRALVAEAASLVVKVEMRKNNTLYINDGTYGGLFDAGHPGFKFPITPVRPHAPVTDSLGKFSLYGPTCDSLDFMPGPFILPADIGEGDYLEIGNLGAYSMQLRTEFNGFDRTELVDIAEGPLLSMYGIGRKVGADDFEVIEATEMQEGNTLPGETT
jgi:ornithine decarboxylase